MKLWGRAAGCICAWLALAPAEVRAADIAWRAPADCQSAELAAAQVEKLIGQRLDAIDWISFEVEVAVDEAGAHRVVLRTLGAGSAPREREITGASCGEVTDAVSVAIALTISEREQAQEPEPATESAPSSPGPELTSDTATEPPPLSDAASPGFALGAGLLLDIGALPNLAPGFEIAGALEWKLLRVGAFLGLFAPQEARLADDRGGTFDFVLGGIDLCAKPELASVHLIACAGFEIGRISGSGDNVADPRLGDAAWYAPRAELGVGYGFAEVVRVWLRAGAAIPLARPDFLLDETDNVHQPSNVSLRGLIAFEIVL